VGGKYYNSIAYLCIIEICKSHMYKCSSFETSQIRGGSWVSLVHDTGCSLNIKYVAHGGCYHRNSFETRLNCKRFEVLTAVHTNISLLGCNAFWFAKSVPTFWRYLESSSAWKMWEVASSKILAHIYQTVWQHIPEYLILDSVLPFRKIKILCRRNERGLSVMDQLLM
jgi:hypothetical protein